jgi:hypothetical protein
MTLTQAQMSINEQKGNTMKYLQKIMHFMIITIALAGASQGNESWGESYYEKKFHTPFHEGSQQMVSRQAYSESSPLIHEESSSQNCLLAKPLMCAGTAMSVCTLLTIGINVIAPFLAGFSYQSEHVALASFIWNAGCTLVSLSNCSKNGVSGIIMFAATACALLYWGKWLDAYVGKPESSITNTSLNHGLYVSNTVLCSISPSIQIFTVLSAAAGFSVFAKLFSFKNED